MPNPRIAPLDRASITDPELVAILEGADRTGAPPASWHLVMAHHPELAKARAAYWEYLFRGGLVEHRIKEQVRIYVAELQECGFCSTARATEDGTGQSCTIPMASGDDARADAALRLAKALTVGMTGAALDQAYAAAATEFSPAEVLELGCLVAHVIGGTSFVRSLDLEPAPARS